MSEPRAPDWFTATPGKVRITSESCEKPVARASSPLITVTDEPVFEASIGVRLGEMTSSSGRRVLWALAALVSAAISAPAARPDFKCGKVRHDMLPNGLNMSRRRRLRAC